MKYFYPGIIAAFLLGWLVVVFIPSQAISRLDPLADADTGDIYPVNISGEAAQGRAVYAANGCVSCHTQQVRVGYMGPDLARKWGVRQSVARDYMYENAVFLGSLRAGPDLADVGARDLAQTGEKDLTTVSACEKEATWHYLHLYNPRILNPKSNMPSFAYLFEDRKIIGEPSPKALQLPDPYTAAPGHEIIPSPDAERLVAYLLSLDKSHSLPEAKKEVAAK